MSLAAGIIGLPNVGKSTIFNAVCSGKAAAENYPFCTIDPNHGVVAVPDERLARITALLPSRKVVPAFLELIDIAGLVKGASMGEGLGNRFLAHIKDVDAVVHVVRCFDDSDVIHVDGTVDPVRDMDIIAVELLLKDLETAQRGLERVAKAAKSGEKELKRKAEIFQKTVDCLSSGNPVSKALVSDEEREAIRELQLLTSKPVLYAANIAEGDIGKDNKYVAAVRKRAKTEGAQVIVICGRTEAEIAELPEGERKEFLEGLGLHESGLNALARTAYRLLGLETFFTVSEKENHAWTIKAGTRAPQAAGVIHSDFEKGFIRADVYSLEDLEALKTEAALRTAGKIRSEGHEYIVNDGDIIFFKFNV